MKKTQFIELLHTIGKTWVSFFSIMMFVALGAGLYLGIHWGSSSVVQAADDAYQTQSFHDFDVTFPLGITKDDLASLATADGVSQVEGYYTAFATFSRQGAGHVARIQSATSTIDQATCLEGTMPVNANECALDSAFAYNNGFSIGDQITLDSDGTDSDGMKYLTQRTFTVTAFVRLPSYISSSSLTRGMTTLSAGSADCFIVVPEASFDKSAYAGGYPCAFVRCSSATDISSFTSKYAETVSPTLQSIKNLGSILGQARFDNLAGLMDKGYNVIDTALAQIDSSLTKVNKSDVTESQLDAILATYDLVLASAKSQLQTVSEKAGGTVQEKADTFIDTASTQLADAESATTTSEKLSKTKTFLETSQTNLQNLRQSLDSYKTMLDSASHTWYVSDRDSNSSVVLVNSYIDVTNRLRLTMASLFLIVGLLVCYTAVSRIVHEQVVSIGTKKALGLRSREITVSYLLYSALAVIVGIIIGALAAVFVIEGILNQTARWQFTLGQLPYYFSLADTLQIGLIELVLICFATWFACHNILKRQAVNLLKGDEPPSGKIRFYEKWKAWDRMSLYSQAIVNNCFNDKLRVFGTLVGIAGCTALVVVAVTMYVNVQSSFDVQYADVYDYDTRVSMNASEDTKTAMLQAVEENGATGTAVFQKYLGLRGNDGLLSAVRVEVPDDPAGFLKMYHLNSVTGAGTQTSIGDDGIWISAAYADHQGKKVGDTITLVDASGNSHDLQIAGIFEYYLNHNELVMSKQLYQDTVGSEATANTVLIALNGTDSDALFHNLLNVDGFFSYTDDYAATKQQFSSFQSLTRTVVFIYLALSALMAAVVLLNLTVMFIEEKKRDLIVLMINGFSIHDAKRYIYKDSIALTIIGIILGLILGMIMGYLSVRSIEFDATMYVHAPSWIACLAGAAASAFFAFVINIISLRRIPRMKLTDINKM